MLVKAFTKFNGSTFNANDGSNFDANLQPTFKIVF